MEQMVKTYMDVQRFCQQLQGPSGVRSCAIENKRKRQQPIRRWVTSKGNARKSDNILVIVSYPLEQDTWFCPPRVAPYMAVTLP